MFCFLQMIDSNGSPLSSKFSAWTIKQQTFRLCILSAVIFYHINCSYGAINNILNYKLGWQLSKVFKTIYSLFKRTYPTLPALWQLTNIHTQVGSTLEAFRVHAHRIPLSGNFFTKTVKVVLPPTNHPEEQLSFQLLILLWQSVSLVS